MSGLPNNAQSSGALAKAGSGISVASDGTVSLAQAGVVDMAHTATGTTLVTYTDGSTADKGIANRKGNTAWAVHNPASNVQMALGENLAILSAASAGTVIAALTITLPPSPLNGDNAAISADENTTVTSMTVIDPSGASVYSPSGTVILAPMLLPASSQIRFLYRTDINAWAQQVRVGAYWYPAYNPAGYVTVAQAAAAAPVQSVAGLSGSPTAAQIQTALSLGSAAYQPVSAFDAAGLASAETTRAKAAEALLAPIASPGLTGTPSGPTAAVGTNTTQLATTAFVTTAVSSAVGLKWTTAGGGPYSVSYGTLSLLGAGVVTSIDVSVTGVLLGDQISGTFTVAPPANITLSGVQVVAAGKIRVTVYATAAITLSAGSVSLNFAYGR